jgi:hypothetical protein
MPQQQSSGNSDNKYLNPGFYSKTENQFWNQPQQKIVDTNGHVDVVLSTTNNGRDYFNECLRNKEKYEKRYKSHNL